MPNHLDPITAELTINILLKKSLEIAHNVLHHPHALLTDTLTATQSADTSNQH